MYSTGTSYERSGGIEQRNEERGSEGQPVIITYEKNDGERRKERAGGNEKEVHSEGAWRADLWSVEEHHI